MLKSLKLAAVAVVMTGLSALPASAATNPLTTNFATAGTFAGQSFVVAGGVYNFAITLSNVGADFGLFSGIISNGATFIDAISIAVPSPQSTKTEQITLSAGTYTLKNALFSLGGTPTGTITTSLNAVPASPVPGPVAGAGLPIAAFALAGFALWRRKTAAIAG